TAWRRRAISASEKRGYSASRIGRRRSAIIRLAYVMGSPAEAIEPIAILRVRAPQWPCMRGHSAYPNDHDPVTDCCEISRNFDSAVRLIVDTIGYERGIAEGQLRAVAESLMPAALKEAPSNLLAPDRQHHLGAFRRVRAETERRAAPLSAEDQAVQSMPDASPAKWHRAHTTWFFETFLVQPNVPGYRVYDERFAFLFNSYYVAAGPRHARPKRGLITRPNAAEVADYRAHVDATVETLIAEASAGAWPEIARILEIGLNHEEQHQELMLTDILHAFAHNPTNPVYDANWQPPKSRAPRSDE